MSFLSGNLIQLNVTVRNPYLFCKFHYNFETTIFPYVWQRGDLFVSVNNVTSNLLLTLDTAKDMPDLNKLTILDIKSMEVILNNNLPVFDHVISKVVNHMLVFYAKKIIQFIDFNF
ncbi:uncharacterized protein LOC117174938 [Belonocnema kinseyi]|uniref:uncharacterized protein LOC117174938 n=1 Tax=Belonocnema kinseyi TaxID=2817044 RepID=UPI00143D5999|nr:uncharacterized protein LOC117174938 [Belonocnema kinseyi]